MTNRLRKLVLFLKEGMLRTQLIAFLKYLYKANTGGQGEIVKLRCDIGKSNLGIQTGGNKRSFLARRGIGHSTALQQHCISHN